MMIPFFLGVIHYDYVAFENFIVRLSYTKLVGYPLPELLGVRDSASVQETVSQMKRIFGVALSIYGLLLIGLSYLSGSFKRWKYFLLSIGIPLFILLLAFWVKFNADDHIVALSEKKQLFQITFLLIIICSVCLYVGLKKPKPKKRKRSKGLPAGSPQSNLAEFTTRAEPPDTASMLAGGSVSESGEELESGENSAEAEIEKEEEEDGEGGEGDQGAVIGDESPEAEDADLKKPSPDDEEEGDSSDENSSASAEDESDGQIPSATVEESNLKSESQDEDGEEEETSRTDANADFSETAEVDSGEKTLGQSIVDEDQELK